mmetsp:Transcript_24001/g.27185  ORF Transcript_24001/g.27185 Transcript_24001/m.27185 type:complete len:85 (+) Transcript_24001:190-444(+)
MFQTIARYSSSPIARLGTKSRKGNFPKVDHSHEIWFSDSGVRTSLALVNPRRGQEEPGESSERVSQSGHKREGSSCMFKKLRQA